MMLDLTHDDASRPSHTLDSPVSATAVRTQLQRLLECELLSRSQQLCAMLRFVVEETLEGRGELLKAYTIGISALARRDTFDPQADATVRVHAHRLRQALTRFYEGPGRGDPVSIELKPGSYEPRFSWREAALAARASSPNVLGSPGVVVRVTPFRMRGGDLRLQQLCEGITEELRSQLTRFDHITVLRADGHVPGKSLGARYSLDGTAWSAKGRLRIAATAVDLQHDRQIWSDRIDFHGDLDDPFLVQELVARAVAQQVADERGVLASILGLQCRTVPLKQLQCYEAVLRFHNYDYTTTAARARNAYEMALETLQAAVDTEPHYALAWAMLAHLHVDAIALGQPGVESPLEEALRCARIAVNLAPFSPNAHLALAYARFMRGDLPNTIASAKTTLRLNPSSNYCCSVAGWLMALAGAWDEGVAEIETVIARAVNYPRWIHFAPFLDCFRQGRVVEAAKHAYAYNTPAVPWDPLVRAVAEVGLGSIDKAEREIERLLVLKPDAASTLTRFMSHYVRDESILAGLVAALGVAGLRLKNV